MIKKYKFILLSIIGTLFCQNSFTNPIFDIYIGGIYGIGGSTTLESHHTETYAPTMSFGGVAGIDIAFLRIEAEYNHLAKKIKTDQAMLNAYIKPNFTIIKPYIGVGIGKIFDGDINMQKTNRTTGYQGMLGLTFDTIILPIKIDVELHGLYTPNIYNSMDFFNYDTRIKARYIF